MCKISRFILIFCMQTPRSTRTIVFGINVTFYFFSHNYDCWIIFGFPSWQKSLKQFCSDDFVVSFASLAFSISSFCCSSFFLFHVNVSFLTAYKNKHDINHSLMSNLTIKKPHWIKIYSVAWTHPYFHIK